MVKEIKHPTPIESDLEKAIKIVCSTVLTTGTEVMTAGLSGVIHFMSLMHITTCMEKDLPLQSIRE